MPYVIEVKRTHARRTAAEIFSIRYEGPEHLTTSTGRYELTENGTSLSVADKGIGNVLNGLEFNHVADAVLGVRVLIILLPARRRKQRDFETVPAAWEHDARARSACDSAPP